MKRLFFILLVCIICSSHAFANKHALIIAIGDYPTKTGWGTISSANDVTLIKQVLLEQDFMEENITILLNEQATYAGIIEALKRLQSKIVPGDIVVIHYSGHGQQIMDNNGEEIDDMDEALIPYDAWVKYTHNYKGENHLRDDELGRIITSFRNDLEKNGQLLLLLDSCHSGSATRGGLARGSKTVFAPEGWKPSKNADTTGGSDMFEKESISESAAPFVLISGASANELNYEYEGYGSLSYAFSKAMSDLGTNFTYRQLFSKISSIMNVISPNQTPTIEGDKDYKLFKGDYVKQEQYYEVISMPRNDVIKIQAGKLHGIFKNTTVSILPAGSQSFSQDKVITTGKVALAKFNESNILLDKPLPNSNNMDYWVFINDRTYGDIALKVYMDSSIREKELKIEIGDFLKENKLGEIVTDSLGSEVTISKKADSYRLSATNGSKAIADVETNRGEEAVNILKKKLFNYAQGQYLKNLDLKNPNYEFSFRLLPKAYDVVLEEFGDTLAENSYVDKSGMFQVRPNKDHVVLEVTNKGKQAVYFSIIEINSQGEINPFMPNRNCTLNNNERRLEPGKTMIFSDCVFSFAPPYEKLVLKGFASNTPINFQSTIETRGEGKRSMEYPLESFLAKTYVQTRSGEGNKVSGKVDGYSTEFIYEIIKE